LGFGDVVRFNGSESTDKGPNTSATLEYGGTSKRGIKTPRQTKIKKKPTGDLYGVTRRHHCLAWIWMGLLQQLASIVPKLQIG